jgi:ClpP class serine protease
MERGNNIAEMIKESKNKKEVNSYLTGDHGDIVTMMEEEWPEMTKEFKRLQKEQYELFLHKQHDYGPGNISVGTQLQTEEEVHLSLTGLWFRMNDKIQRLKTLLMGNRDNAVEGEPMEDAYLDVSNYGIMATIVKNGKWGK